MSDKWSNTLRRVLLGPSQDFSFKRAETGSFIIPDTSGTNLYIHIPFCKSMCPYCPYNTVKYEKGCEKEYLDSLLKEIDIYYARLGKINISSAYIGGGTPTNLIDEIPVLIDKLSKRFNIIKDIAIETSVSDINKNIVKKLKDCGINMVSVGVQSFHSKYLKLLERKYGAHEIEPAMDLLKEAGFELLNIDLIFLFPGQSRTELIEDLDRARDLNIDQVTVYPLFTFPYSSVGRYKKVKRVIMPKISERKKFYRIYHDYFEKNGYSRVSVWSFKKKDKTRRYSSVTRQYFIGIGAGAGSRFENKFYFNTFSLSEYQKKCSQNILPVSIEMEITKKLSNYYKLYWKLYEGFFSINDLSQCISTPQAVLLLKILLFLRFCKKTGRDIELTEKGSFWIHLIQNHLILDYINEVWSVMGKEAFPVKISL